MNEEIAKEIESLQNEMADVKKNATAVALIAALLGGGGIAGVLDWIGKSNIRAFEAELTSQQIANTEIERRIQLYEAQTVALETALNSSERLGDRELTTELLNQLITQSQAFAGFAQVTRNYVEATRGPGWYKDAAGNAAEAYRTTGNKLIGIRDEFAELP